MRVRGRVLVDPQRPSAATFHGTGRYEGGSHSRPRHQLSRRADVSTEDGEFSPSDAHRVERNRDLAHEVDYLRAERDRLLQRLRVASLALFDEGSEREVPPDEVTENIEQCSRRDARARDRGAKRLGQELEKAITLGPEVVDLVREIAIALDAMSVARAELAVLSANVRARESGVGGGCAGRFRRSWGSVPVSCDVAADGLRVYEHPAANPYTDKLTGVEFSENGPRFTPPSNRCASSMVRSGCRSVGPAPYGASE